MIKHIENLIDNHCILVTLIIAWIIGAIVLTIGIGIMSAFAWIICWLFGIQFNFLSAFLIIGVLIAIGYLISRKRDKNEFL